VSATTGAFNYTDNAATANNVVINGFGADDKITVTGATATQTSFQVNGAGDVIITVNTGNGVVSQITLMGADPSHALVYSATSFNALPVGDIFFQ
jgi:hypothetical protein